jgi:hypothetical protein
MSRTPLVVLLACTLLASTLFNPLAGKAARYSQEAAVAAVAIYATLRSTSAVLAIARDADVGVNFPVEATFSPGQTLTPVTQTIERFADIMFVVALWSGLLAVLLAPAASVGAVAAGVSILALALLARQRMTAPLPVRRLLRSAIGLGLLFALLLPLAYSLAFVVGDSLTREATREASEVLTRVPTEEVEVPGSRVPGLDDIRALLEQANAALALAGDLFVATVDLTVAYLLKLVVLPILLGLVGWWLVRALASGWDGADVTAPGDRPGR